MFRREHNTRQQVPYVSPTRVQEPGVGAAHHVVEVVHGTADYPELAISFKRLTDVVIDSGGKTGDAAVQLGNAIPRY